MLLLGTPRRGGHQLAVELGRCCYRWVNGDLARDPARESLKGLNFQVEPVEPLEFYGYGYTYPGIESISVIVLTLLPGEI